MNNSWSVIVTLPFQCYTSSVKRGVAQPGSAPRSGRGGRRFKSSLPDQYLDERAVLPLFFAIRRIERMWQMDESARHALRSLPSVSDIISNPQLAPWTTTLLPTIVVDVVRHHQDRCRQAILNGDCTAPEQLLDTIVNDLRGLAGEATSIVVNGTGVVIHTNLGRSPVSQATSRAMAEHAARYQALEVDMETGERGGRGREVERLMTALTGAERTLVVNNNAAAVLLTLAATSAGREVIVSRGEAVEIGGGFRVPDVLLRSGAQLVEVGTTNRTYLSDYEAATNEQTSAYLKVHASNFAVLGFTATATVADLAPLARSREVLLIEDVGSGCLLPTADFGLEHEPTLAESIAAGADVVCASGDKLLGGPQAGLIIGRAAAVNRIARHPLARALRADKTCLAGLAATLRHYIRGEATEHIPVWWAISRDADWLETRVHGWKRALGLSGLSAIRTESVVGGGSLPGRTLPSWALSIETNAVDTDRLARVLRTGSPGVVPRIVDGKIAIDARTVLQDEDQLVVDAVRAALT